MQTQNLRLNVQPLANYVCKVQFAWQAKNKIKTNNIYMFENTGNLPLKWQ